MVSFEAIDSITSRYSISSVLPTCVVDGSHKHCSSQKLLSPQAQFYISYGFGFQYHPERLQLPIQKGGLRLKLII